jgi:hypothetical protein
MNASKQILTKPFKVVAVSSNTNSFGLNQMVLVAKDGNCFKACKYNGIEPLKQGDIVIVPVDGEALRPNFALAGFEIPELLPNAPQDVVNEVWKTP